MPIFQAEGASFSYSSIPFKKPLTLTLTINRDLQSANIVLINFVFLKDFGPKTMLVYCAGADLHPLVNINMMTQ